MRNYLFPLVLVVGLAVGLTYNQAIKQLQFHFGGLHLPLGAVFTPGNLPQGQLTFSITNPTSAIFYATEAQLQILFQNTLLGVLHLVEPIYLAAHSTTTLVGTVLVKSTSIITSLIGLMASGNLNQYLTISGYIRIGPIAVPIIEYMPISQILDYYGNN